LKYKICDLHNHHNHHHHHHHHVSCVYTGISTGITEYKTLHGNIKLLNKRRYEYENHNSNHGNIYPNYFHQFSFNVDNFHSSNLSLHRMLGM